jgi:hypothetical protein
LPSGQLKTRLTLMVGDIALAERQVQRRVEQAQSALETYFDNTMDRIAGWYRRRAQFLSLAIGLALAIIVNADSLLVAAHLWSNQTLRSEIGQAAEVFMQEGGCQELATGGDLPEPCRVGQLLDQAAVFPLGWQNASEPGSEKGHELFSGFYLLPDQLWHRAVIGWFITGLAVSMGAPFWFDTLQRLLNLRASGRKPKT